MDTMWQQGPMEIVRVDATISDAAWVEVIGLAMKVDLEASVRRRVIEELLTIRQMQKMVMARPLKTP